MSNSAAEPLPLSKHKLGNQCLVGDFERELKSRLSEKYKAKESPQRQGCFLQKNVKI